MLPFMARLLHFVSQLVEGLGFPFMAHLLHFVSQLGSEGLGPFRQLIECLLPRKGGRKGSSKGANRCLV